MKTTSVLLSGLLLCAGISCREQENHSTAGAGTATMYFNGDILTMEGNAPAYVQAVVKQDGKIRA